MEGIRQSMRNYSQNVTKNIMQIWPERDEYIIAGVSKLNADLKLDYRRA